MKLLEFRIQGYKNLKDVVIDFGRSNGKTLIVGTNGSGKSNLIEAISAIFSALYNKDEDVSPRFRILWGQAPRNRCKTALCVT